MGFYHAKDSLRRMVLTSADENRASAFADFNRFPSCIPLKEVAAGRDVIASTLRVLFDEVNRRLGALDDTVSVSPEHIQQVISSWGLFMEGFMAASAAPANMRQRTLVLGQAFGPGGSSGKGGSGGGRRGGGEGVDCSSGGGCGGGGSGGGSGGSSSGGKNSSSDGSGAGEGFNHGGAPGSSLNDGSIPFPGFKMSGKSRSLWALTPSALPNWLATQSA